MKIQDRQTKQKFKHACKTFTDLPDNIGGVIDAWMHRQADGFHIYHLFRSKSRDDHRAIVVNILYRAAVKEPEPVVKPGW